jgi:lipopolysaccharide/colanic/teichoic acid biosynthesis glycosyltransferase
MVKRLFDLFFSLFGILFLSPVLLFIAIWIKIDSQGPVLFIQTRVGLNGVSIGVFKYRTMVADAESKGLKITVGKDPRITKCGHFLRKYKLDELAQLLNVVNGTMSFVGPRPEVKEYIDFYPDGIKETILSVRPGITDFASIEFKDENDLLENAPDPHKAYIEEILPIKQKYYIQYVKEQSILLDIKLIFKTIITIIK